MKVYVSGPMTGLPKFNFPAFDEVEELLVAAGCDVFSPAANDRVHWAADGLHDVEEQSYFIDGDVAAYSDAVKLPVEVLYRDDFNYIINEAEAVVMLPGWEKSTGGRYERALAEALGLQIVIAQPVVVNAGPDETWEWELTPDGAPDAVTKFLRLLPSAEVLYDVQVTSPEAVAEAKQAIYDNGYQDALDEIALLEPAPVEVTSLAGQAHEFTTREHLAAARTGLSHVPGLSQHFDRIEANLA